jgi:hypothetical protein
MLEADGFPQSEFERKRNHDDEAERDTAGKAAGRGWIFRHRANPQQGDGVARGGLQVHMLHGGEPYFETPETSSTRPSRRWSRIRRTTRRLPAVLPLRKALVEKLAAKNGIHVTPTK